MSLYPAEDLECNRILVIGLGKPQEITLRSVQEIGRQNHFNFTKTNLQKIIIDIEDNRLQRLTISPLLLCQGYTLETGN